MIPAPGREPTEKKLINIPDKLVEEIDKWAIGMFSSRAEFLDEAIRTFTRDRLFNDRKTIVKLQKEYAGEALGVEAADMLRHIQRCVTLSSMSAVRSCASRTSVGSTSCVFIPMPMILWRICTV